MSSRPVPWRQKPPDGFEEQLAAAASARMFLLQEIGPTSFVVKEAEPDEDAQDQATLPAVADVDAAAAQAAGMPATAALALAAAAQARAHPVPAPRRRRGGQEKFKVQIGSSMKCSCKAKGDMPCLHLLFVLLKILRVPPENPFLWQASLLDHEIEQVLRGRFQASSSKRKKETQTSKEGVQAKPIEPGDVCAICQEDLYDEAGEVLTSNGPLVFCKQSCGNSVHAKCMKA